MSERKKWMGIVKVTDALGGTRSKLLEEALNDMIKQGRIETWRCADSGPCIYDVLTTENINTIETELILLVKNKMAERKKRWPWEKTDVD
ncbi:MAG: hypothetical protein ACE5Z5_09940 [Candidatus Bathyarchaeia archaeon]